MTVATAVAGIWFVSVGVIGFFRRAVPAASRLLFIVAGLTLMIPADAFSGAIWTDLGGGLLGALLVVREIAAQRRNAAATAQT